MPISRLFINDVDMSLFGLWVNTPSGWADAPQVSDSVLAIPGTAGGLITLGQASIASRQLRIEGVLIATTAQEAHDSWDAAKQVLASALLEIRLAIWPDRVAYGRYQGIEWQNVPTVDQGAGFAMTFLLPNPYLVAIQPDVYSIARDATVPITLGTAPSHATLFVSGLGLANPQVLYKDAQGLIRGDVSFALTLDARQWIGWDTQWQIASRYASQVSGPTRHALGAFDVPELVVTRSFVLDPGDGSSAQGPTLTALNCNLVAQVRKSWR